MCACVLLFGWDEVAVEIGRISGSVLGLSWGAFIMSGAIVDNYVDKVWITFDVISAVFIEEVADFID